MASAFHSNTSHNTSQHSILITVLVSMVIGMGLALAGILVRQDDRYSHNNHNSEVLRAHKVYDFEQILDPLALEKAQRTSQEANSSPSKSPEKSYPFESMVDKKPTNGSKNNNSNHGNDAGSLSSTATANESPTTQPTTVETTAETERKAFAGRMPLQANSGNGNGKKANFQFAAGSRCIMGTGNDAEQLNWCINALGSQ